MKTFKKAIIIIGVFLAGTYITAEINYRTAVEEATRSAGTDISIEAVMASHGFNVGAMDTEGPTVMNKIMVLFN